MIAFVVVAALMVAVALAWILVPLLRGAAGTGVVREASNVAILRDQLRELEADLANGTIAREQYDVARRELEQRVLEESQAAPDAAAAPSPASAWAAAALAAALPIAAMLIYVALGNFDAFSPLAQRGGAGGPQDAQHAMTPEEIEKRVAALAAQLDAEPDNAQGWIVLARTYYALNRFPDAARAFERATALAPRDAALLADYADALAAAQGAGLTGKPLELIEQALAIDPTQWKALALAGTAAFDRKDYAKAIAYWERMKATVPPGSQIAQSIDASIAEARELGGIKAGAAPAAPATAVAKAPAAAPAAAPSSAAAAGAGSVAGTVTLAPALAAKASPDDVVFVFARPAQGAKMPLAILRKQVRDLPLSFALDDSMAMAPNMALSNFGEVVVGARVSRSGQATPTPGDLEGTVGPVKVGTRGIAVVIDTTVR